MTSVLLALWLGGCGATGESKPPEPKETVLLLHGLGRTRFSMRPLERALQRGGFDAREWPYNSLSDSFASHADRLKAELLRLDQDPAVSRIHLVGHSLGGIVARAALRDGLPAKFGRLVLLAPPNQGSPLASTLAPLLGGLIEPLRELSDAPGSAVLQLRGPEGVEIGIIAASADGKVPVASTHLDGETDHLVVAGFHTFLMNQEEVQMQVLHFLRHGQFDRRSGDM
ncbi:MAG: alpha/beta fold hydrolase [Planctomycetota bacterium]